jgi:carbonic anhydrase
LLKTKFDKGDLEIHGWFFDLESGKLFSKSDRDDWLAIDSDE